MPWIDTDTGEVATDCPLCAATREAAETQVHGMELERRKDRSAMTRLKNEMEAQKTAKRDAAVWKHILACWLKAFPDKRPTATGVKSARATAVFARLDSGATEEDVLDAIRGAWKYPYMHFRARVESPRGPQSYRADDLQDIMHTSSDALFDWLRDAGAALREGSE